MKYWSKMEELLLTGCERGVEGEEDSPLFQVGEFIFLILDDYFLFICDDTNN